MCVGYAVLSSSAAMRRSRSAIACSSIARCAGAEAPFKSASARMRARASVARSARRAAFSRSTGGPMCRRSWAAASCCASTDLLSKPLAMSRGEVATGNVRRFFRAARDASPPDIQQRRRREPQAPPHVPRFLLIPVASAAARMRAPIGSLALATILLRTHERELITVIFGGDRLSKTQPRISRTECGRPSFSPSLRSPSA